MPTLLPVLSQSEPCGATSSSAALETADAERLARIFKALGDPTRLRLLSLISASDAGEVCLCDLTAPVHLSQPTVSHHMRILVEAGLAAREQRGRWSYYRVVPGILEHATNALRSASSAH